MFPDRQEITKYYQNVLATNDKQGVCCNPFYPEDQVAKEIALHSLSTLQPLSQYRIMPTDRILDIGCGAGADCFLAAHRGGPQSRVFGVDIVKDLITRANNLKDKFKISNIEFENALTPPLPYENSFFDLVLMNYSFHLFKDKAQILGEIERVLVNGGKAIIADSFTPKDQFSFSGIEDWLMGAGGAVSIKNFKILTNSTNLNVLNFVKVPETEIIGYMICQKKL